jgi:hypothetical protein
MRSLRSPGVMLGWLVAVALDLCVRRTLDAVVR